MDTNGLNEVIKNKEKHILIKESLFHTPAHMLAAKPRKDSII